MILLLLKCAVKSVKCHTSQEYKITLENVSKIFPLTVTLLILVVF